MKKKIFSIMAVIAVTCTIGWSLNQKEEAGMLSDLASSNLEALASRPIVEIPAGVYYIADVTATSHTCHSGGPFSCDL